LGRNAASTLASPEKMNFKKVFYHRNNILLLHSNIGFPSCSLFYVEVLLLALSLYKYQSKEFIDIRYINYYIRFSKINNKYFIINKKNAFNNVN
jgi:hypothetical protein